MIYAIGDVHGSITLLKNLYFKILEDIKATDDPFGNIIIFLGDLVDRGENSKAVLDFVMNLKNEENKLEHLFLKGNHEQMLIDSFEGIYDSFDMWTYGRNGGKQTLKSFGISVNRQSVKNNLTLKPYIEFIKTFSLFYTTNDYIFCHSGYVMLDEPFEDQEASILWGRPADERYRNSNKIVVHGHTVTSTPNPIFDFNKINVDCGAGWPERNTLACVVLPMIKTDEFSIKFIQV